MSENEELLDLEGYTEDNWIDGETFLDIVDNVWKDNPDKSISDKIGIIRKAVDALLN